jgi:hypothetical protein
MRILKKVLALCVYAMLFLPTSDYRITAWMRAVETMSTSLDRTMRRRKSRLENERLNYHVRMLHEAGVDLGESTQRIRCG